ncbi:TLC domain-containing protein 2 [Lamellibrachia satsuma]|nr:TLC domain-containing protein 2 [Lamellibrachia satsuma]
MMSDLINHHTIYSFAMIAFSTGYFLYDFIDIIINKKILKFWEVLIHHVAVGGMFFYNVIQCQCIAYNVVALLAEINTIFLHTRKLLQAAGTTEKPILTLALKGASSSDTSVNYCNTRGHRQQQ